MSYEICVLDPKLAATKESAFNAWNEGGYAESSRPDSDRTASKWRIQQSLSALEPAINWREPDPPRTGLFAALAGKRKFPSTALIAELPAGHESIGIGIFDEALEIDLPWNPEASQREAIVRDLWRLLEQLSQIGMSTIYDTERDVMLDLATDFDAVLKRYIENVSDGGEDAGEATPQDSQLSTTSSLRTQATPAKVPAFTGNAGDSKPWWKIW